MLFILNRDYQVMGVADNTSEGALHYFNDKLTTDLTAGVSTFEFDVYKTNPTSAFLQEGNYITLKDTHGKQLLFTIMEMEEDSTKKSIYCEDVGLDLLNETVPPIKSATAQPISWYIQQSTNDSGWQIGTNQVSHLKRTLEYEGYSNALQRILSICNSFDGVEVDFTVEFKGNAVTKQLINIYRKRGKDSGLRYNAGIDLAEARRTVSLNDLATALRGVGSEITNKDNEVIGNTTFTNIVYDDGRYFTTKGSPFVFDREANKRWSRYRNMQSATQGYIVDYFSYDTKSEQELFNRALSQLKKRSEPAVEYEIEISKIKDNLMVGDTIEIVDNYFQPALHLQARVLAVTTSETVDSDNKLKLGNYKIIQSSIDEKLLALQAKLNSIKLSWSENNAPVLVVKSTNGEAFFNNYIDTNLNASIIRGGIDITNSYTSNDVVWRKRDRFGVNVSGWNRTGFSIPLSIEDINTKNTFVATVDGMEAQITIFNTLTTVESPTAPTEPQQGQIWLDTSVQPPIQKVYLGGKWKHVTPITEEEFEEVKAISELASSGVESLNGELDTVKDNVAGKVDSTTYTQKVSAIESALANKVEQSIQQADKLALEGEIAKKVAQADYDTKVSALDTAISGYETRITETETGLLATAKQTDVNAIEGRLSTAETGIETNATQIALKASTSDLNATNGRLSTAEGKITVNAQNIASKVSQTDFDTVEGRLDTAESTITQQAGLIESKVAKTTYDTDINNATTGLKKKMSNAESRITQTEKDITSKVSQTTYDADINNATTGLKKRISTAESSITQQATLIASKVATTTYTTGLATKANASDVYKKSEVDTKVNAKANTSTVTALTTRVTNAESKITQTEKDIALRATKTEAQGYAKTAVDGIEIGGRNYLRNSDFSLGDEFWDGQGSLVDGGLLLEGESGTSTLVHNITEVPEGEYTLQVWYEVLEGQAPYLFNTGNSDAQASTYYPFEVDKEYFEVGITIRASNLMPSFRYAGSSPANHLVGKTLIKRVQLEKGNIATDWAPAPEDVQAEINAIETRISDAELLITPEAITATVVESEDLTSKLKGYATQEALGNHLSNEDFTTERENIIGEIDSRIGAIDYSPFVQTSELEQKTNAITAKISQAGGVNLIQNSIGWAGKDFWSNFSATAGVAIQNDELSSMGFGSGWYSQATGQYVQKQRLTLPRAGTYTLSFWLKKTVGSSWAYVQIQKGADTTFSNANAFAYAGYSGARLTDGYELFTTTFEATELDVAVSISINTGVEATITGIMLHEGSEPFKWQPYTSEVYNTNVKMDINGITVKNNQDAGYTLITPDEFSGYAPVDGTVERVFTLNGDTTEVKKLKAEQQFEMAPVTIITIDNLKYSGWAFI